MGQDILYLVELSGVELNEKDGVVSSWIHALPLGDYVHPVFGKIQATTDKIKAYADSVKNKVRGIDPSINYNHNNEDVASGWVKDAEARDTGLWVLVEWTKAAVEKIRNKEYRYFSAEYQDNWKDQTGKVHTNVFFGGALTNRPYMKNLVPINLSETSVEHAFGLVDAINKGRAAVADEDLKKFNELMGLPPETNEDELFKAVSTLVAKGV